MDDQAETLRRLAVQNHGGDTSHEWRFANATCAGHSAVRVMAISSGKGGVGKTHIVVNLAYALQRQGARVLILDADLGLGNVDVLLGIAPQFTLQHVIEGTKTLAEILVEGPVGIMILPAGSGIHELSHLTKGQQIRLLEALDTLDDELDFVLVDTGAGISTNVMYFNIAAQDSIIVVTPEPTSLTDAYALVKVLATQYAVTHFKVLLNMVASAAEAEDVFHRLTMVTQRFLHISLEYLGYICRDTSFSQAVRHQQALLEYAPHSAASQCVLDIARNVLANSARVSQRPQPQDNLQFFWRRLLSRRIPPSAGALHSRCEDSEGADHQGVMQ
jgi:flagellar biosynthesis protein FlhG